MTEVVDGEAVEVDERGSPVSTAVATREEHAASVTLFRTDDPVEVVERATRTANALMGAIRAHDAGKPPAKKMISVISGRDFPKVETWMLLGSMLGVFPVLDGEAEEVTTLDGSTGFKATVNAVTRDGSVVGRATAYCLRSESAWARRDAYALASMAQTRATSKALAMPLRFVMILAGLEGTPAEEMTGELAGQGQDSEARSGAQDAPQGANQGGARISDAQMRNLQRLVSALDGKIAVKGGAEGASLSSDDLRDLIKREAKVKSMKDLSSRQARDLIDRLKKAAGEEP